MTKPTEYHAPFVPIANETGLLQLAASGNQQAYSQLYTYYYPRLYTSIYYISKVHEDTEEVLQEAFLKVWVRKENLILLRSFEDYVFRIAKNQLFDLLKRKKIYVKALAQVMEGMPREQNGDYTIDYKEYYKTAVTAIEQLGEQKKQIFLLRTQEERSFEEIAAIMNISIATVKKHFYSAFHSVRAYVLEHGGLPAFLWLMTFFYRA